MEKKIGIIGIGNMGSAIIKGIINSNIVLSSNIFTCDKDKDKEDKIKEELGVNILPVKDLVKNVDILFLAVKPNVYMETIAEIKNNIGKDIVIVSIMAGVTIRQIEQAFEKDIKVIRSMPNTPALVLEGMSALCKNTNVLDEDIDFVKDLFSSFGKSEVVNESLMDIVTAVSGSGPAYIFMLIEAMADAAVKGGLPRDKAYTFASQTVLGSAKMVMETGLHPGVLKDMVTSPMGTTIAAVKSLEETGFRSSIMNAVEKAYDRSKELGK